MSVFAKRLKAEREKRKAKDPRWTQGYVADLIGVARTTYTSYESAAKEPPFETLTKLSEIFDVSADYLLGRSVARTPEHGMAFSGGGKDWTEEELRMAEAIAAATIENMRKQQGK